MTNLNVYLTQEARNEFLYNEVKKVAKRYSMNSTYNFHYTDLESYLMVRIWEYATVKYDATKNPNFEAYIRTLIKQLTMNFVNSPTNVHSDVDVFTILGGSDDEGNESDFESTHMPSNYIDLATTVTEGSLINDFMLTLTDRQRTIIELRAGILSSLTSEEYEIAREIMDKQLSKQFGEVYLSNSDIAKIIGIGRVKVQNHLVRISEKALDFGLETTNW